jgi:hypothetical protein
MSWDIVRGVGQPVSDFPTSTHEIQTRALLPARKTLVMLIPSQIPKALSRELTSKPVDGN